MLLSLRIAARAVFRNWRHSIATVLSVALGVIAVASIRGYIVDVEEQFGDFYVHRAMTGHVIVEAKEGDDDADFLDGTTAAHILEVAKQYPGQFASVVRFLSIEGMIAGPTASYNYSGLAYDVVAGEVSRGEHWAWNSLYGTPLKGDAQSQIVVGKGLAELLGCKTQTLSPKRTDDGRYLPYGQPLDCMKPSYQLTALTDKNQMNAWDANLVGIVDAGMREMEGSWIMMPLDQAQKFVNTDKISMIGLTLKNPAEAQKLIAYLHESLGSNPKIKISFWHDHKSTEVYRSLMGIMDLLQFFMLLVVASVSVLSMINSITRNIDERRTEIGTLRAIGYKNGFVSRIFAWEGFFLGLGGTVLGTVGIILILSALNASKLLYFPALISQKVPLRIAFVPASYLLLAVLLSLGSAVTALIVAKLRIGKNIADILK